MSQNVSSETEKIANYYLAVPKTEGITDYHYPSKLKSLLSP